MQADTIVRQMNPDITDVSGCSTISPKKIQEMFVGYSQVYLLLDTTRLLRSHYQVPSPSAMEMPETPTLNSVIGKLEPFTTRRFIWEKTKFDDRKERGPVLVQFDSNSPLVEEFIEKWSRLGLGALILSTSPIDELQQHFSQFIEVGRESGGPVKLNLECPSKLSCVFNAISENKLTDCLGAVDKMFWSEVVESKQKWFFANSSGSSLSTHVVFSETDFENIQKNIQERFITNTVHDLKHEIKRLSDASHRLPNTLKVADDAQMEQWVTSGWIRGCEHGFSTDIELYEFIKIVLFYKVKLSDQRLEPYLLNTKKSPELRIVTVKRYLESGEQYAA